LNGNHQWCSSGRIALICAMPALPRGLLPKTPIARESGSARTRLAVDPAAARGRSSRRLVPARDGTRRPMPPAVCDGAPARTLRTTVHRHFGGFIVPIWDSATSPQAAEQSGGSARLMASRPLRLCRGGGASRENNILAVHAGGDTVVTSTRPPRTEGRRQGNRGSVTLGHRTRSTPLHERQHLYFLELT